MLHNSAIARGPPPSLPKGKKEVTAPQPNSSHSTPMSHSDSPHTYLRSPLSGSPDAAALRSRQARKKPGCPARPNQIKLNQLRSDQISPPSPYAKSEATTSVMGRSSRRQPAYCMQGSCVVLQLL